MTRRYRPALLPSGKARAMTRQIALGAVIAFTVTVLVLSVWEPKPPVAAVPEPAPPIAITPLPLPPAVGTPAGLVLEQPIRPAMLKPENIARMVRRPPGSMLQELDAGVPAP